MDVNSIINLLTTNEKLLFGLAVLAITITITQLIKIWDKANKYVAYYGIIPVFIGGVIGYIGGHYLIPAIDDAGALLGIVATFIYDKAPDNIKAKLGLVNNSVLSATQLSSDRADGLDTGAK